jgi:hypothetical protein
MDDDNFKGMPFPSTIGEMAGIIIVMVFVGVCIFA